eukprot:231272_1
MAVGGQPTMQIREELLVEAHSISTMEFYRERFEQLLETHSHRIFTASLCAGFLFVMCGLGSQLVALVVGTTFPIFMSYKAIRTEDPNDDKQWLTYWIVYAVLTLFGYFTNFILRFVPFYHVLKVIFLVGCMAPNIEGARLVYTHFIEKFIARNEDQIDRAFTTIIVFVAEQLKKGAKRVSTFVQKKRAASQAVDKKKE